MEWKTFDVDGDSEGFFQWILLSLAETLYEGPAQGPGYARTVSDGLISGLRFLETTVGPSLWGPLRLYASLGESPPLALLCGEAMERPLASLRERIEAPYRLIERDLDLSTRSWALIGLALPGWVILFSEDVEEACQDAVEGAFSVVYLPAREIDDALLDPLLSTAQAWHHLFTMTLRSLPHREVEGPLEMD